MHNECHVTVSLHSAQWRSDTVTLILYIYCYLYYLFCYRHCALNDTVFGYVIRSSDLCHVSFQYSALSS
jgi:hypothetical protein